MESRPIVRIKERSRGAFVECEILGLNIFQANGVHPSIANDPQVVFLGELCGSNNGAVNIGNLFDYADDPHELFAGTDWEGKYLTVTTGCYGGQFYDSTKWNSFPPLFFDHVSESFFQITTNGDSLIRKILLIDAMAYFISPKALESVERVVGLLNAPFESSDVLIQKSLDFYRLIGFSHADGDFFSFAYRSKEDLSMITKPLDSAVDLIESSEWYRENASALSWDEEYSACLRRG